MWPLASGAAGAVGLIGAHAASTVLGLIATYAIVAAIAAGCMYCLHPDVAPRASKSVRWVLVAPLVLLCAFGLVSTSPSYGSLVVLAVAATSPPVGRHLARALGRRTRGQPAARHPKGFTAAPSELDRTLVDQRFVELVSCLEEPGEPADPEDDQ